MLHSYLLKNFTLTLEIIGVDICVIECGSVRSRN